MTRDSLVTLDVGIIGLASFYGPAFAKRAAERPDCSVVAATAVDVEDGTLSSLTRPTRSAFAATYDCSIYDGVGPVLEAADAVVVATRTSRRASDVCRALNTGVPALVAKPAADGYDGARRIAEAADADVPVTFTTPARYDDAILGLARRVEQGAIGEVVAVRAQIRHDRVPMAGIETNAEHAPDEAGSAYAMAVYTADALLWLSDSYPAHVTAEYTNRNSPHSAHPDTGTGTVRFADGTLGTMTMTYSTDCRDEWGNWEVEVVGTDGIVRTGHHGYEGIHWHGGDPDNRMATAFARTTSPVLERTFDAFVETIGGSRPWNTPTSDEMAAALGLCQAWESADETRPISFETWPPTTLDG